MLKLSILSIGKTKEKWLEEACSEYIKRLKTSARITCLWGRDEAQLVEWANKEAFVVCLDPKGLLLTSEELSGFLMKSWETGGSRLSIVIGGANGLPMELKQKPLISLSRLTFTHQMTRLILLEQIYRSLEIQKGSQYHK